MSSCKTTYDECNDCGAWCCKHQIITLNKVKEPVNYEHWIRRSSSHKHLENDEVLFVIDQPCPHLKNDRCDIYEDRGDICSNFPDQYIHSLSYYCKLMKSIKPKNKNGYKILTL